MLTAAVCEQSQPNLASIIKECITHEFVPLLLVRLLWHRCTGYVDDRTLWRHRENMLTAGL
jgi:hypothetical protein